MSPRSGRQTTSDGRPSSPRAGGWYPRETINLLFSADVRRKYALAIFGTAMMALADAAGLVVILPLMQLLTGSPRDQGLLGWISHQLGDPASDQLAVYLALIMFGAFLVKGISAIAFRWWLSGFVARQEADTSTRLLRYYLDAPYGLHLRRSSADLLRTMNDAVRGVYSQVVVSVMNIVSEVFTVLAVATTLILLVPIPALLLLVYFALAGAFLYGSLRPTANRAGERLIASWVTIYKGAMHALGGIKEIKIRHVGEYFLTSYEDARGDYAGAQRIAGFLADLPKYVFEVLFVLGLGSVTVFVFTTAPTGQSVGTLAVFGAAGFRLLPSAVRLVGSLSVARLGRPSLRIVIADLREADSLVDRSDPDDGQEEPPGPDLVMRGEIQLDHIGFTHEGRDTPAVRGISLTIPAGGAVALVGASGAGKSTLVDILLGLYRPSSGHVYVDGVDIQAVLPQWQKRVGLVPQEVYLLDDTLRANIAFGKAAADIDQLWLESAIAGAQLGEFVASLPDGLDTVVGERGARLSGGQRQRIGIARALYTKPELLILDEATSALDNETERRIAQTIARLHGSVTIVMVAHRLSTVRNCDTVVFLQDGEVAASGGFDELQLLNDDFARLVALGSLA